MKTTKLLICTVAIAAAFAAVKAQGQNLPATLIDISPGAAVTGTFDNSALNTYPSGVLRFTEFDAFCVEPSQEIAFNQSLLYQFQDPSTLASSNTIARLVGGYLASSRSNNDAAAVQWAIWEVTSETLSSLSLSDGSVRIAPDLSSEVLSLANQYLSNVNTYSPATISYLTNTTYQNVVSWNAVPEPGSIGLVALSAAMILRRRRA